MQDSPLRLQTTAIQLHLPQRLRTILPLLEMVLKRRQAQNAQILSVQRLLSEENLLVLPVVVAQPQAALAQSLQRPARLQLKLDSNDILHNRPRFFILRPFFMIFTFVKSKFLIKWAYVKKNIQ